MALDFAAVRPFIGQESGPIPSLDELDPYMIRHWTEVAQDTNPLYHDEEYARKRGHPNLVMPPTMLPVMGLEPLWSPVPRPRQPHLEAFQVMSEAGFSGTLTIELTLDLLKPVYVGDRLTYTVKVLDISPEPTVTDYGEGHLVKLLHTFTNQKGEPVGRQESTVLKYRMPDRG